MYLDIKLDRTSRQDNYNVQVTYFLQKVNSRITLNKIVMKQQKPRIQSMKKQFNKN